MYRITHTKIVSIAISIAFALASTPSLAGGTEAELKHEISFLAKELLDLSGEDSITVEQPAFMKPFIGICSEVYPKGVKLTCITPGNSAAAAGLKTGDLILKINDVDVTGSNKRESSKAYYGVVKSMKIGDKLAMKLIRKGKEQLITVTVGAISHPAYTLTVKKK